VSFHHIEELADTIGMSLKVWTATNTITGKAKKDVTLFEGCTIQIHPEIVSSYHDSAADLAILVGIIEGKLGFIAYNGVAENGVTDCIEFILLDFGKLNLEPRNVFELNKTADPGELAKLFEPALICHLRRNKGAKTYSLIDDRRSSVDASKIEGAVALQSEDGKMDPLESNEQHESRVEGR
jgi:hypothetical protein